MRLTKRSNISMRVLMYCGVNALYTQRGRNGGMRLSRPMEKISVGEVFRATEASVPITECFADGENTCPLVEACRLKDVIARATEAFYASMDGVYLSDLVCENAGLDAILASPISCPQGMAHA